jgi:hypothetical protein
MNHQVSFHILLNIIDQFHSLSATVVRPSLVASLFSAKPSATNNKLIKCGQCEKDEAKMVNKLFYSKKTKQKRFYYLFFIEMS